MSNPRSANERLTVLRALLHGPASDEAWGWLCRALEAIEEPNLLDVALDLSRDALGRRRVDWHRPAQLVPAAWLGAKARGEREPRLSLLEALGIERASFALIPAGRFLMGSPEEEAGRIDWERQHEVVLSRDYAMGVFPVTQGLWTQVMGTNPSRFQGGERAQADQRPVESITWFEAVAFCNALSDRDGLEPIYRRPDGGAYTVQDAAALIVPEIATWEGVGWRLPTEAEWEYACRGRTQAATYAGDLEILGDVYVSKNAPSLDGIGWYAGNSGVGYEGGWNSSGWSEVQLPASLSGTHPVGQKGANGFGLHDTLGNVFEWCWDWYEPSHDAPIQGPIVDPVGPGEGRWRVQRGGSWLALAREVRAAHRGVGAPFRRFVDRGLRLVRSSPCPLEP